MADFGGVIKLRGVAEYKVALANVSQQLRETGSALKVIATDFEMSDRSEQSQMYTLKQLNGVLEQQKSSYERLKSTYDSMRSVYSANESNISRLNVQYVTEKAKLEQIGKTLGTTSTAYKNQETVVAKLKQSVSNATLTQQSNETELSKVKTKLNEAKNAYLETSEKVKKFSDSVENSSEASNKASSGGYSVLKNIVANILTSAFQRLTSLISGQFSAAISRVDDIRAFGVTLQNLGFSEENVTETTQKLVSGIEGLPTSLPQVMQLQKQFLSLSGSLDTATDLTLALNNATLAGGQGQEIANSALTQWYQIIANGKPDLQSWRIINQAMPAQLNTIAESLMGAGKNGNDLFTAWQKGTVTTEQVTGALIKLNKEGSGAVASFEQQALGASGGIGTAMSNIKLAITNGIANMIKIIGDDKISSALNGFKAATKGTFEVLGNVLKFIIANGQTIITILIAIGAALLPILVVTKITDAVSKATVAIKSVTSTIENAKKAFTAFNTVLAANPILLVVAAVSALIVIFISLWNNCEEFRNFFINLWQNIQNAVSSAVRAIGGFFANMWSGIQAIFGGFVAFFSGLWQGVVGVFSGVAQWFGNIFSGAWNGITSAFSAVGSFFASVWDRITAPFRAIFDWFRDIGGNIVKGIWDGITGSLNWIKDKITGWVGNVLDFFKKLFGINSPSKLFRDEIGVGLAEGIGVGFEKEMKNVYTQIDEATPKSFDIDSNVNFNRDNYGPNSYQGNSYFDTVSAFKEALSGMTVEMDNENMGNFVKKTVTKAIYA